MKWTAQLEAQAEAMRARAKAEAHVAHGAQSRFRVPVGVELERLPGKLAPFAMSQPCCTRCHGVGHTLRGRVCACVLRRMTTRPAWLVNALWEAWVVDNGGPAFPRSTLGADLRQLRNGC